MVENILKVYKLIIEWYKTVSEDYKDNVINICYLARDIVQNSFFTDVLNENSDYKAIKDCLALNINKKVLRP